MPAFFSDVDFAVAWTSGQEELGFINYFTDIRVAQIQNMQEEVARSHGLRIFDFGHIWEGYQGKFFTEMTNRKKQLRFSRS